MLLTGFVFALDCSRPIKSRYIAQVRRFHIRVRLDSDPFYQPSAVKAAFSGAEVLEVEAFRASFEAGDYQALDGFLSVRGVKRALVYGSIDSELAKRLEKCMMSRQEEQALDWEPQGFNILGPETLDTSIR